MEKTAFKGENKYQIAMTAARKMLKEGIITSEDYQKVAAHFREKYAPLFDVRLSVETLPV